MFSCTIAEYAPDIIASTESWLTPSIYSNEIFPDNYNVFKKDCLDGYVGVFLAVRNSSQLISNVRLWYANFLQIAHILLLYTPYTDLLITSSRVMYSIRMHNTIPP